jgi:hypothetical protein
LISFPSVLKWTIAWAPTVTEELRNDVPFALRFKVGRKQQPLTDTERDMVRGCRTDRNGLSTKAA